MHLRFPILILLLWASLPLNAHDHLAGYIQHSFSAKLSGPHLEIAVRLVFFENVSGHLREDIDSNSDGNISRRETVDYLHQLVPTLSKALRLQAGSREIPLLELYPPAIDLDGTRDVAPARHTLTLHYFARVEGVVAAGEVLHLTNNLWPDLPALPVLAAAPASASQPELIVANPRAWAEPGQHHSRILRIQLPTAKPALPDSVAAPSTK